MDADLSARFSRQTMLAEFGEQGQQRLGTASALIVGLGGLGSPVSTYLACAGIGHLGLADPDTVSLSNLQRQVLYTEAQIGEPKTLEAAARLSALRSDLRLTLHPEGLTAENARDIISGYDLVMDCTDNFATRYLIDDVCTDCGVPG
ncbi:MAG: HesA/MoeB/ThiF family protein, partial [Duncaniella sp.]|nr:HesA/MoeB/ThiF family protein [Duncaniella sp.]